jgi:predicted transposase YdaD
MSLPFDATLKDLVRKHTADFERAFRLSGPGPAIVLNVDLATISAATDVTIGYGDPPRLLIDLNFQAGRDAHLPARVRLYNALLHHRYRVPVHSLVVLLRPAADAAAITGRLRYQGLPRRGRTDFRYEVIRLWQRPVRRLLTGGPGSWPLAVLGRLPAADSVEGALTGVVREIDARARRAAEAAEAAELLAAAFVLTGLRVPKELSERIFGGVRTMRESSTYQGILEEGRIEGEAKGLRKVILRLGRKQLGVPDAAAEATLGAVTDVSRLERMSDRLLDAASWQDLLATP